MLTAILKRCDSMLVLCFDTHDWLCAFIIREGIWIKWTLRGGAFLSLFFIFLPHFRTDFGSLAENMLLGILFLSPLAKIFPMRLLLLLMGLRREFGILMGCFALVHSLAYFIGTSLFTTEIAPFLNANFFSLHPILLFGIVAFLLTLPAFLTSNNMSMRLLGGKNWKRIHRSVYVLFVAVLLHVYFVRSVSGGVDPVELMQAFGIIGAYIFLKMLAWKNFLPFLQHASMLIQDRYAVYILAKKVPGLR